METGEKPSLTDIIKADFPVFHGLKFGKYSKQEKGFYLLIYEVYNGFPAITKFTKGIDSFGNIPYFCCRKQ